MKRGTIWVLVLALVTLLGSFGGALSAPAERLPAGDVPSWTLYASGAPDITYELDEIAYEGARALKLSSNSSRAPNVYLTAYQTVQVQPETSYELRLMAKAEGSQNSVWFGGGPGWTLRQAVPAGTYDWQPVSTTYTTGSGETTFTFRVVIENKAQAVWLDKLELMEAGTTANLLRNGGFEIGTGDVFLHGFETTGDWVGSQGASGTVTGSLEVQASEGEYAHRVIYTKAPERNEWLSYVWNLEPKADLSGVSLLAVDVYPLAQTAAAREPLSLKVVDASGLVIERRMPQLVANEWNTVVLPLTVNGYRDQIRQISINANMGATELEGREELIYLIDHLRAVNALPSNPGEDPDPGDPDPGDPDPPLSDVEIVQTVHDWSDFRHSFGSYHYAPIMRADAITIDGTVTEWDAYTGLQLPAADRQVVMGGWGGSADLSATVYFAYDDDAFYMAARVTDNVHYPVRDSIMWRGDSLQLAFSENAVYGPDYGFNVAGGETQIWSWNPGEALRGKSQITYAATEGTTEVQYEMRIPWTSIYAELPTASELPFTLMFNDSDGSERRGWIEWTKGIGKSKDPSQFAVLDRIGTGDRWSFWVEGESEYMAEAEKPYQLFIPNYSDEAVHLQLTSTKLALDRMFTVPANAVLQLDSLLELEQPGNHTVDFQLNDGAGHTSEKSLMVEVLHRPEAMLAGYDALEAQVPVLENLLLLAESEGHATDYERISFQVIKEFIPYGRADVANGRLGRSAYVIRTLEAMVTETQSLLQQTLNGSRTPLAAPRYKTGSVAIDGFSFIGTTEVRSTGVIEERPVFFNGYGHFAQVKNDVPKFQDLGANIIQIEIGPRNVIFPKDNYVHRFFVNKNGGANGTVEVVTAERHSGEHALRITNASPRASNVFINMWQTVEVEPNTTYNLKLWAKGEDARNVWFPGGAGWSTRVQLPAGTYDWTQVQATYTTGPNETTFNFMVLSENSGTIYVDDLEMTKQGESVNLLRNPGFEEAGGALPGRAYIVNDAQIETSVVQVLDRAAAANIAVNVLVSPHYFPDWALVKWPELRFANNGFIKFNIAHPIARQMMEDYLQAIAAKVKDHPALHSLTITNEPVYQTNVDDTFLPEWHAWLQAHYETVESLNTIHGSAYLDFAEVPMPDGIEPTPMGYDWVLFNNALFTDWHEWMTGILNEAAPGVPVHAKVMAEMKSSLSRGLDLERFSAFSQINGNDSWNYLGEGGKGFMDELSFYDLQASFKPMPVYNSEHHIIADGDVKYVPKQADHARAVLWQGAVHGKSASTIWIWERTYNEAASSEGSILHRPDVVAAVGRTNHDLNRLAYEVTAFQHAPAKVGLLYALPSLVYEEGYETALLKAYAASSYSGQKTGFITEEQLAAGNYGGYEVLVVAGATHAAPSTLAALAQFAADGGTVLVMDADALSYDPYNRPLDEGVRTALLAAAQLLPGKDATVQQIGAFMRPTLEAKGLLGLRLADAASGLELNEVGWQVVQQEEGMLLNVVNYSSEAQSARLVLQGGGMVSGGVELISGTTLQGDELLLQPLVPYLLRLHADPAED